MAGVVVTPTGASDLARLIDTHSLPVDTITPVQEIDWFTPAVGAGGVAASRPS